MEKCYFDWALNSFCKQIAPAGLNNLLEMKTGASENTCALYVRNSMEYWEFAEKDLAEFDNARRVLMKSIGILNGCKLSSVGEVALDFQKTDAACATIDKFEMQIKEKMCDDWNKHLFNPKEKISYKVSDRLLISPIAGVAKERQVIFTSLYRPGKPVEDRRSASVIYGLRPEKLCVVSTTSVSDKLSKYGEQTQEAVKYLLYNKRGWLADVWGSQHVFLNFRDYRYEIDYNKRKSENGTGEILLKPGSEVLGVLLHDYNNQKEIALAAGYAAVRDIPLVKYVNERFVEVGIETIGQQLLGN